MNILTLETKVCEVCKTEKSVNHFRFGKAGNKVFSRCKNCAHLYGKNNYGEKLRIKREGVEAKRLLIETAKAKGCLYCRETTFCCLHLHHVVSSTKDFDLSSFRNSRYSLAMVQEELSKCVCVCANCHAKIHVGLI